MGIQAAALWFKQLVTPTRNPVAGENFAYFKSDNKFYGKSSAGTEFIIGPGAAPGTHSHVEADLPTTLATDTEVATAITNHTGAADPHPGYLTPTEGNAAYSPTGHTHPPAVPATHSHPEGDLPSTLATDAEVTTAVSNHAAAADPHPVYLTSAEGNAAYATSGHVHAGLAPMLDIKDDDTLLTNAPVGLNFRGAGVAATGTTEIQITIPGIPIGGILMWPAAAVPVVTGQEWLLCDGTSYPNATYPVLAPILRLTAAFVVDANNFRTPDMVRRVAVGAGGGIVVGRSDGIATQGSRTFAHNHTTANADLERQTNTSVGGSAARLTGVNGTSPLHAHTVTNSAFDDTPSMCVNFIIRAL